MSAIDHWHPVLRSKDLRDRPVGVRLHDNELVFFRTTSGKIGCLDDICPHRRMRLSLGTVVDDRLRCSYHGWAYDCEGRGTTPGTPKLHVQIGHYDAVERHGAIWVKSSSSDPAFPQFYTEGYYHLGNLSHVAKAPLELVLDNLTEVEHTPTTHLFFGYDLGRMAEVEVEFRPSDDSVRTINAGPSKHLSWLLRLLLGIQRDFHFVDDWTVYFSPVHAVFDHYWMRPDTKREGKLRWRMYVFCVPLDSDHTLIQTFAFIKSSYPGPYGGARLFWPLVLRLVDYEIQCDVKLVENLANKSPRLEGMKLSRFDRGLGLNRERIDRLYRTVSADNGKTSGQRRPQTITGRHGSSAA
ncbi:MAG: iron-sulfur cluster-binding protein, Rieske family [Acidobacteria bacterium]|nr:MAG: iron-sulfur cluster-binding protein, Rieske family [Acidobacteriota bacterium]